MDSMKLMDKELGERLARIERSVDELASASAETNSRLDRMLGLLEVIEQKIRVVENSAGSAYARINKHAEWAEDTWKRTFLVRKLNNYGVPGNQVEEEVRYENAFHYLFESLHYGGRFLFWQRRFGNLPHLVTCDQMKEWDDPDVQAVLALPGGALPIGTPHEDNEDKQIVGANTTYNPGFRYSAVPPALLMRVILHRVDELTKAVTGMKATEGPTLTDLFATLDERHPDGFSPQELGDVAEELGIDLPKSFYNDNRKLVMQEFIDDGFLVKVGRGLYKGA